VLCEFDAISCLQACRAEFEAFNAVLDRHEQGLVRMYLGDHMFLTFSPAAIARVLCRKKGFYSPFC
jgi:hypothetical protein